MQTDTEEAFKHYLADLEKHGGGFPSLGLVVLCGCWKPRVASVAGHPSYLPCGPISWFLLEPDEVLVVAGLVGFYGLGVAWFLWKPSGWSKAVFILLSVLWLVFGGAIVCLPV